MNWSNFSYSKWPCALRYGLPALGGILIAEFIWLSGFFDSAEKKWQNEFVYSQQLLFDQHPKEALKHVLNALDIVSNQLPEETSLLSHTMVYTAVLYRNLGEYKMAQTLLKKVLAMQESDIDSLPSEWLMTLAEIELLFGHFNEAEMLGRKAGQQNSPNTMDYPIRLAQIYFETGNWSGCEQLLSSVLINLLDQQNIYSPISIAAVFIQSRLKFKTGYYHEAQELARLAASASGRLSPPNIPTMAESLLLLAQIQIADITIPVEIGQETLSKAERLIKSLPLHHPIYLRYNIRQAELFFRKAQFEQSLKSLENCSTAIENQFGNNSPLLLDVRQLAMRLALQQKKPQKALMFVQESITFWESRGRLHLPICRSLLVKLSQLDEHQKSKAQSIIKKIDQQNVNLFAPGIE